MEVIEDTKPQNNDIRDGEGEQAAPKKSDSMGETAKGGRAEKFIEKFNISKDFKILTDSPIPDLNTSGASAFQVSDVHQRQNLYAIILPNTLPIRFETIQALKKFYNSNYTNIQDAGFTDVAGGKYGNYSVILEKPLGRKLSDLIESLKNGDEKAQPNTKTGLLLSDEFIANEIVNPINEILKSFADTEIFHGCINHRNVYLESLQSSQANMVLKESISEPPGLSQPHQYEPIHRAQAIPLGKGQGSIEDDYFALGVLVYYCLFGDLPGQGSEQMEIISNRLKKGSYNIYLGYDEASTRMTDLLRGLLNDSPEERWGYSQIVQWLKGKRSNLIRPTIRKEAVRSYEYAGVSHFSRRALANTYYRHWEEASEDIRSGKLQKWLDLSVSLANAAEEVASVIASTGGAHSKSRREDDELIAKVLVILDPMAPIRHRNIAAQVDGLGAVLANAWENKNQYELQTFSEMLRLNLADFKATKDVYTEKFSDRWLLQKLNNFITKTEYGFGVERCLYDMNHGLPCQSEMLIKHFIIDINQLLYFLNDNASRLSSYEPVDRHIASFLASKMDVTTDLTANIQLRLPERSMMDQISKLTLLAFAQRKAEIPKLAGLASWITARMENIVNTISNKKLRKEFKSDLERVARMGDLTKLVEIIAKGEHFRRDYEGLREAKHNYNVINQKINYLRASKLRAKKNSTYHYNGLYIAKIISIFVLLITLTVTSI